MTTVKIIDQCSIDGCWDECNREFPNREEAEKVLEGMNGIARCGNQHFAHIEEALTPSQAELESVNSPSVINCLETLGWPTDTPIAELEAWQEQNCKDAVEKNKSDQKWLQEKMAIWKSWPWWKRLAVKKPQEKWCYQPGEWKTIHYWDTQTL